MVKNKSVIWVCQECGAQSPKWNGKCDSCGQWNTIFEEIIPAKSAARGIGISPGIDINSKPTTIASVEMADDTRITSGSVELDRVLGGGIVHGSFVMVGGEPGIGKSTLLTQLACNVSNLHGNFLYVSGEESMKQVRLRAERLGALSDSFYVVSETDIQVIEKHINTLNPAVVVIDSIQTVYHPDISSAPGSVVQVRECAASLLRMAKINGTSIFIVGHVTKDGTLAGPRVLEHMVDTVLYLEGERHTQYRILHAMKNRFGALELGVFETRESGLIDVPNASELFLAERPVGACGSVIVSTIEGTRPMLVEVQALVGTSNFQNARRTTNGIDINRVQLLIAVLEKRLGIMLGGSDAYVKITGGIKVDEPAVDLGLAIALASSFRNAPVDANTVVIGEVGLAGEVRAVSRLDQRIKEAEKMGFTRIICPISNLKNSEIKVRLEIIGVSTLIEALEAALS